MTGLLERETRSIPIVSPSRRTPVEVLDAASRHRAFAPLTVGAFALLVSLIGITRPSLWYDEAATVTATTRSWAQLWDMLQTVDAVHALYYFIIHAVFDLVGYSPLALRAPSAVAVGVAAALIVLLCREFRRPTLGVIAGLVFAILPRTIWMGGEGRSFALSTALAVLVTLLLVRAIRRPSTRLWIVYAVVVVFSCVLFVYVALVVVAHAITMAVWWSRRPPALRGTVLRDWVIATGSATLVLSPFILFVRGQAAQVQWIPEISRKTLEHVMLKQFFFDSEAFAWVGWILLAVGAVALLRTAASRSLAAVLLPVLVVPSLILLGITAFTDMDLYSPRYVALTLPFVALTIGAAIDWLPRRRLAVLAIAALVAIAIPQLGELREVDAKQNTAWSTVAETVGDERALDAPGTTTAIIWGNLKRHPLATARVVSYAYPAAFEGTVDVTLETPAAESWRLWEKRGKLAENLDRLEGADVVYLITSITRDRRPATTEILQTEGYRLVSSETIADLNVLRFERTP